MCGEYHKKIKKQCFLIPIHLGRGVAYNLIMQKMRSFLLALVAICALLPILTYA